MKLIRKSNGVTYIISEMLPCTHAFATRVGGVSTTAQTASLNLAFSRGDSELTVIKNLERLGAAVGFDPCSVISLPQVHSSHVRTVDSAERGFGYYIKSTLNSDGYVTTDPAVTLGIKTADCVPILLCATDEDNRTYAAAALHAGWRGTALGIVISGVDKLSSLGVQPEHIRAAIGPAIGQCCFEIDENVKNIIIDSLGAVYDKFIRPSLTTPGKWHADLVGINASLLRSCGVPENSIDAFNVCTACNPELFYSHRRDGEARGTMLSVININRIANNL